jgi:hypothetical protein
MTEAQTCNVLTQNPVTLPLDPVFKVSGKKVRKTVGGGFHNFSNSSGSERWKSCQGFFK